MQRRPATTTQDPQCLAYRGLLFYSLILMIRMDEMKRVVCLISAEARAGSAAAGIVDVAR